MTLRRLFLAVIVALVSVIAFQQHQVWTLSTQIETGLASAKDNFEELEKWVDFVRPRPVQSNKVKSHFQIGGFSEYFSHHTHTQTKIAYSITDIDIFSLLSQNLKCKM